MKGYPYYLACTAAVALIAAPAAAQAPAERQRYEIEAQELGAALRAFSRASGRDVLADDAIIAGKRSKRVAGELDARAALTRLLRSSGLRAELVDGGFVIQLASGAGEEGNATEIVVTGTRIRGAAPVGSPVTVVDRTAIERSGRGTVQSLFETIPSNFGGGFNESVAGTTSRNAAGENAALGSSINLRGLGASSTLVLFDGNRPALGGVNGTFADISLIPQLAIERIEILTDGSSALYGSDAVAGVVNFRFRKNFSGFESLARAGTADGDFGEYQLGQLAGVTWGGGSATAAYQYSERGSLPGAQRRYATDDLRPFGGGDFRSLFTTPGTLIAANGAIFGIPAGQDGRSLTRGQLIPGQISRRDVRKETDLLAAQRSHAVYVAADQKVTDWLSGYVRGFYARREFDFTRSLAPEVPVRVPVTNAFYVDPIGTREPVTVRYDFKADFGLERRIGSVDGATGTAGLAARFGPWRVDLSGSYGRQVEHQDALNLVNSFRLTAALADPDPATAYNVFGDGSDTNPATIDRIRGSRLTRTRSVVWSGALRADGPLFALPAGSIRLAVGAEHRDERLSTVTTTDFRGPGPTTANLMGLPASRGIDAVYGELLVPLLAAAPAFPGSLDVTIAARHERYSDFGATTNPKVGIAWRPLKGMTLRGSFGRSFRAPGFGDLVGPSGNLYQTLELDDPQSPTGKSIALGLFGYSTGIGPEKATTWTTGADLADWPIDGLKANVTYFNIGYRDRIASATADFANYLTRRDVYGALIDENPAPSAVAGYFADPLFFNPLGVTPGQVTVIIDALLRNLSSTTVRGLDVDVELSRPLGTGTAMLGLSGTRLFAIDQQITATSPAANIVSTIGNPVRSRWRARTGWSSSTVDATLFVNRVGGYRNQTVTPVETVRSWTTVDASIGYRFPTPGPLHAARLALSALNLFDADPPYVTNRSFDSTLGYDPEQASAVGRLLAVQLTIGW
ncbi:TonB-dependent receptor [Sphingomonas donggukensis]|uniref:TonB-dependent receptor n=1 Tax=Sphingomonas donggukensis TaxID=2949093 RepID=A0ABY4TU76_9SPHN|nr:TonB-dependent receptor [Sphingomonas donggukensis]URW75888.1 TonB-dependent receptor [Sphingomonas donggukensis]